MKIEEDERIVITCTCRLEKAFSRSLISQKNVCFTIKDLTKLLEFIIHKCGIIMCLDYDDLHWV